ncbi:MAG: hypothetical protein EOM20_18375 [Spartobacteria bacterium]|nr:hypothetical protein [Spartobacteria bacterium]
MKCKITGICVVVAVLLGARAALGAWTTGTYFRVEEVNGKPCLIDPAGKPFKSVGMVWAYGPDRGPAAAELTPERVVEQLELMQSLGFNTLNLYGDRFIPEMLDWCDEHEMAVYFRTCYFPSEGFPSDLREFPDYMDAAFRQAAKAHYVPFIEQVKDHPSVLAIDMDHRWLFPLEWTGAIRFDTPKVRPAGMRRFPGWLADTYTEVERLNAKRGTDYASFHEVLADESLVADGAFLSLSNHPLRVDVVNYTLWTAEDFLRDLATSLHGQAPFIVTPTTEHPECLPEVSPAPDTGIAFMSPVHYNGIHDFIRDPYGLCKLIYETRWHYDMQGGPPYISETGWRTDILEQSPPNIEYAWLLPPTEENMARAYAEQMSLLSVLPWISGYGYFKLYDKWVEGDFGYLRDDGTKKPLAFIGDAINRAFDAAALPDKEPTVWIYYPTYAQASHKPGFQQLKSFVAFWEKPFLDALSARVDAAWEGLRAGDQEQGAQFARQVTDDFNTRWRGFAFARALPDDDRPIVLLSSISELLSPEDRAALADRKTISFGLAGVRDDAMRPSRPWSLEVLGLTQEDVAEAYALLDISSGNVTPLPAKQDINEVWQSLIEDGQLLDTVCRGQFVDLDPHAWQRAEVLAGAEDGNAAPSLFWLYEDRVGEEVPMAPTVSDMRFPPRLTGGCEYRGQFLSHLSLPLRAHRNVLQLILPEAPWTHLFAVVLVSGGMLRDAVVEAPDGEGIIEGVTPWRLALPADTAATRGLETLWADAEGNPLLVAKGPHVVFLYDALTWGGKTGEISQYTALNDRLFNQSLTYLYGANDE